ncbi:MAG TPA: hypothetical protein VMT38_11165 [Terracidiphilus sp.]|nr:hypothetical protein [Terracidiphilus sp.]
MQETFPSKEGFFRFGPGSICYGSYHRQAPSVNSKESLRDALSEIIIENGMVSLPFYPAQVFSNLSHEAYVSDWRQGPMSALSHIYYWLRPILPVGVRRHLQKIYLKDWKTLQFPRWPVDCSLDHMMEELLLLSLRASGEDRIPFIWFWPDGSSSSAVMTHDVETQTGYDFCSTLMDVDDTYGIKSSFQVIPEERYTVHPEVLGEIRKRGFEICVHDLNHDGHLYKHRDQFLRRVTRINAHGKEFGAQGFRAAVLYRKQLWYDALDFSFDMSVPNVAHLDPQRGGCCTVMPYFFENGFLEIPVTTIQDYSLFNIMRDYSISLWKQQTEIIMGMHGCMSFIAHPDYLQQPQEMVVYKELLAYLNQLRRENDVWITTPGEINRWWRQRAAMRLVQKNRAWHIEGDGSERARTGFASEENGRIKFSVENSTPYQSHFNGAVPNSTGSPTILS